VFKTNAAHAHKDVEAPESAEGQKQSRAFRNDLWKYLVDACIIVAMGALLFWGVSTQFWNHYNDATRYQCYAIAFWQGEAGLYALGLDANPKSQCAFLDYSSSTRLIQKMHALPPEYPLLTLAPFSLALIAPTQWYQAAFALWMAIVAAIIYIVLRRYRSMSAAIVFTIYLALGSWATALGRFDLIPAGLTLGAVILAGKTRWKWASALLALATLLKFYPVVLIPPFLIAQQMQTKGRWFAWRRWSALGVFVAICVLVFGVSLILNVADTLVPFSYFVNRPIQIESFPATLLWLGNFLGYPVQHKFAYQSLNFLSPLSHKISLLFNLLLGAGLLFTWWLQWRGKIDIYVTSLLTFLILLVTGKVFSPQYLIWAAPLVAYVGQRNWKWLVSWSSVAILTTIIFPFMYVDFLYIKTFYPVILVRDLIILVITCVLLFNAARTTPLVVQQSAEN
jgi:Glycosyltransferase family 87